jgi:hypothetical protein
MLRLDGRAIRNKKKKKKERKGKRKEFRSSHTSNEQERGTFFFLNNFFQERLFWLFFVGSTGKHQGQNWEFFCMAVPRESQSEPACSF